MEKKSTRWMEGLTVIGILLYLFTFLTRETEIFDLEGAFNNFFWDFEEVIAVVMVVISTIVLIVSSINIWKRRDIVINNINWFMAAILMILSTSTDGFSWVLWDFSVYSRFIIPVKAVIFLGIVILFTKIWEYGWLLMRKSIKMSSVWNVIMGISLCITVVIIGVMERSIIKVPYSSCSGGFYFPGNGMVIPKEELGENNTEEINDNEVRIGGMSWKIIISTEQEFEDFFANFDDILIKKYDRNRDFSKEELQHSLERQFEINQDFWKKYYLVSVMGEEFDFVQLDRRNKTLILRQEFGNVIDVIKDAEAFFLKIDKKYEAEKIGYEIGFDDKMGIESVLFYTIMSGVLLIWVLGINILSAYKKKKES